MRHLIGMSWKKYQISASWFLWCDKEKQLSFLLVASWVGLPNITHSVWSVGIPGCTLKKVQHIQHAKRPAFLWFSMKEEEPVWRKKIQFEA